jgi:hypothetical protein
MKYTVTQFVQTALQTSCIVGRTMALGANQPLNEMSTRNIAWGVKVGYT